MFKATEEVPDNSHKYRKMILILKRCRAHRKYKITHLFISSSPLSYSINVGIHENNVYNILFKFVPLGYLKITLFYFNVTPLQNRVGKHKIFCGHIVSYFSIFNPLKIISICCMPA